MNEDSTSRHLGSLLYQASHALAALLIALLCVFADRYCWRCSMIEWEVPLASLAHSYSASEGLQSNFDVLQVKCRGEDSQNSVVSCRILSRLTINT